MNPRGIMNSTVVLLLSSLLMGTSFLQQISDKIEENGSANKSANTEARTYLSQQHVFGGAGFGDRDSDSCWHKSPQLNGDDQHRLVDGYPIGRPIGGSGVTSQSGVYPGTIPGRGGVRGDNSGSGISRGGGPVDDCRVRIGLRYSSCFSKYDDFDDKFDELRHHVQMLPRGGDGYGSSPCSTLQLLAKVKSTPLHDRCQGNQYLLRTPYHMYNIKGELRYIVQDPPHLEQCYLEAACNIPTQLCRSHGYPSDRRRRSCESRQCHHTLLAWDPTTPNAGTFFDTFEYSCCCNCHVVPTPGRSQIVG